MRNLIRQWPIGLILITIGILFFSNTARGVNESYLTPSQLGYIKSVCASTDSSLNQLHTSDALLRVNLGQMYESISTRLIKRFNSRVSYNNLNNSDLLSVSNKYDQNLDLFRNSYSSYEVSLGRLVSMDCQKSPDEFYILLEATREKRSIVKQNVNIVNLTLDEYREAVNIFEDNYRLVAGEGNK